MYALLDTLVRRKISAHTSVKGQPDFQFDVESVVRYVKDEPIRLDFPTLQSVRNTKTLEEIGVQKLHEMQASIRTQLEAKPSGTFRIPEVTDFFRFMEAESLTASSELLADFELGIADPYTGSIVDMPYSVKSWVKSAPTLLNASGNTHFTFDVENIQSSSIEALNELPIAEKLKAIRSSRGRLVFKSLRSPILQQNLRFIDSDMPLILAASLVRSYEFNENHFDELSESLAANPDLLNGLELTETQLRYKFETMLEAASLGLRVGVEWDGRLPVRGFLEVGNDFIVRMVPVVDHDEFRRHLFAQTRLDHPATKERQGKLQRERKFVYGEIKDNEDGMTIDLRLHIRFRDPGSRRRAKKSRATS